MPEAICLGILVVDVLARPVDHWPQRGQLVLVDEVELRLGGHPANAGRDLARLGMDVAVMGCVGQDGFGDLVLEELRNEGIDTRGIWRTPAANTSTTLVMIDTSGERSFLYYCGANAQIQVEQVDMDSVKSGRLFYLGGALVMPGFDGPPQAQLMAEAQAAGLTTCMDVVWDATGRWMELLAPVLPYTDIFTPGFAEGQQITGLREPGEVAQALLDAGVKIVALTMGPEGCYVRTADTELRIPAYQVETVDGTGAGDAFTAGFIYGYLHEWDLERTTKFANALGGLATIAVGATGGVKDYQQVLSFLQESEPGYWEDI